MTLYLLESNDLSFAATKSELENKAQSLSTNSIPTLIEVQATEDLTHAYFIIYNFSISSIGVSTAFLARLTASSSGASYRQIHFDISSQT